MMVTLLKQVEISYSFVFSDSDTGMRSQCILLALLHAGTASRTVRYTSSPPGDFVDLLQSKGYTDISSIAVVGNGPLTLSDRARIALSSVVIRFNDVNNKIKGEKTTVRVVRHPSWFTFKDAIHPDWHVSPHWTSVPEGAKVVTYIYESQHGRGNTAMADARLFPSCECGDSCLHRKGWAGPSTGAAALSLLQETANITYIHVFGMNWNGDAEMHTDFANKSVVPSCCTKCIIHQTASTNYGVQLVGGMLAVVVCAVALFCCCTSFWATRSVIGYTRKHGHLPFIPLNPAHNHNRKTGDPQSDSERLQSLAEPLLDVDSAK